MTKFYDVQELDSLVITAVVKRSYTHIQFKVMYIALKLCACGKIFGSITKLTDLLISYKFYSCFV